MSTSSSRAVSIRIGTCDSLRSLRHDVEPVHVGQVQVEQDQRRGLARGEVESLLAGGRAIDRVAGLLQVQRDEARDVRLVLDDEDPLAHATDCSGSILARPGETAITTLPSVVVVVVVVVAVRGGGGGFGGGADFVGSVSAAGGCPLERRGLTVDGDRSRPDERHATRDAGAVQDGRPVEDEPELRARDAEGEAAIRILAVALQLEDPTCRPA